MTRKLEDLFDLPSSVEIETENEIPTIAETRAQLAVIDDAIDKIDSALPAVRDLDASMVKWMNWQTWPKTATKISWILACR